MKKVTAVHHTPTAKHLTLIILFLLAFLERTVFDLGPNIELITMGMILASYYFGKKEAFWLTFAAIALTDRFIGNSPIFLFTWSGFLVPALLLKTSYVTINHYLKLILKLKLSNKIILKLLTLTGLGLISNFFFYLWTNFGVWYLDSFNMYPNTLSGLAMSYINGLPFLRLHLTSTLIFIPAGFLVAEILRSPSTKSVLHPLWLSFRAQRK